MPLLILILSPLELSTPFVAWLGECGPPDLGKSPRWTVSCLVKVRRAANSLFYKPGNPLTSYPSDKFSELLQRGRTRPCRTLPPDRILEVRRVVFCLNLPTDFLPSVDAQTSPAPCCSRDRMQEYIMLLSPSTRRI